MAAFRKINMEDLKEVLREIEERAKAFRTIEEWFTHIEEIFRGIKETVAAKRDRSGGNHVYDNAWIERIGV